MAGLPPGISLQELLQLFWGLQAKPASTHIMNEIGGPVQVRGLEGGVAEGQGKGGEQEQACVLQGCLAQWLAVG